MQVSLSESKRPILVQFEVVIKEQSQVEVHSVAGLLGKYHLYLTSHTLIFVGDKNSFQVPLCYVGNFKRSGGFLSSKKLEVITRKSSTLPNYIKETCELQNKPLPPVPEFPKFFLLKFRSEGRDEVHAKLEEALHNRIWERPTKHQEKQKQVQGYGISAIKHSLRQETQDATQTISSFGDLKTLFENSRELAQLANKLKTLDNSDPEILEIQQQMESFGFASGVTKQTAGKNYYQQLAREISDFIYPHLEQKGGALPLVDAYSLYNRARGDLVSPHDMKQASSIMKKLSLPVQLNQLPSGVNILQIGEDSIKQLLHSALGQVQEAGNLTAVQLAEAMQINVLIAKQLLVEGEAKGDLARDEGIEGLHFYINILK